MSHRREKVSHTPETPIHTPRVNRTGGSVWSGVGRTVPIRFNDDTIRIAVREWQSDRDAAMARYGPIADWDTSLVTSMSGLFYGATTFNEPLTRWNTSNVETMAGMFDGATSFNQPLSQFDTSNVRDMSYMFATAAAFDQPLNNRWNTRNVESMHAMFHGATAFNQPIDQWDTSRVVTMGYMFSNATTFNQPLNNRWDTSNVESMVSMFHTATAFNQPLAQWDTGKVENMNFMFANATAFNQSLFIWNTHNVRYMGEMFSGATAFNQPLHEWDIARVVNMARMFDGAAAFNPHWAPVLRPPVLRLPVRRVLHYDVDDDHDGRLPWDAQRHAWQAKWTAMQQQKPDSVVKVRKAHLALYDEWPGDDAKTMCQTCFERPRSVVFIGCRHLSQCEDCYARWASAKGWVDVPCPDCRAVSRVQNVDEYLSEHTLFVTGGRTPSPPVVGWYHRETRPTNRRSRNSNTVRGSTKVAVSRW
jgi:surface protein